MVIFYGVLDINSEEGLKEKVNRDDIKMFYYLYININILFCLIFSIMMLFDCWWWFLGGVFVVVFYIFEVILFVFVVIEVVIIVIVGYVGLMMIVEGVEIYDVIIFVVG